MDLNATMQAVEKSAGALSEHRDWRWELIPRV